MRRLWYDSSRDSYCELKAIPQTTCFDGIIIFRDTGYEGSFLPDHMPSSPGDPGKLQAYAFGYGYIHALINSVNSEVS